MQSSAGAAIRLLPRIDRFIEGLSASPESMDWFDPALFARMVLRGSLYQTTGQVVDDLVEIRDFVKEKSIEAGDFKETAIERLALFFYRVDRAARDPAFLSVFRRIDEERVALAVRNIDPWPAPYGGGGAALVRGPDQRHALACGRQDRGADTGDRGSTASPWAATIRS